MYKQHACSHFLEKVGILGPFVAGRFSWEKPEKFFLLKPISQDMGYFTEASQEIKKKIGGGGGYDLYVHECFLNLQ